MSSAQSDAGNPLYYFRGTFRSAIGVTIGFLIREATEAMYTLKSSNHKQSMTKIENPSAEGGIRTSLGGLEFQYSCPKSRTKIE